MSELVWIVKYQMPVGDDPRAVKQVRRTYRDVSLVFRSRASAHKFFDEEVRPKHWFDESVCYIEGPVHMVQ